PASARALAAGLSHVLDELGVSSVEAPIADVYLELFGADGTTEDEVTVDEYRQAMRAAELGVDESLRRRGASDITIVPDTTDLAAYVEALRARVRAPGDEGASTPAGGVARDDEVTAA